MGAVVVLRWGGLRSEGQGRRIGSEPLFPARPAASTHRTAGTPSVFPSCPDTSPPRAATGDLREASIKALLAQCVRWSVVDWLRFVNAKKRQPEKVTRSSRPVETLGAEDPGIAAIIWPKSGATIWAIGGVKIREVFGQDLERIPHRALLRAVSWNQSYAEILREFAPLTRGQLRGRIYRARRKADKLWKRALAQREWHWEQERRDAIKHPKVGGFRGGRHTRRTI